MTIENGHDCRNWLKNPEDHMAIKEKRRMLRFKLKTFKSALYEEKRVYQRLIDGTERRKANHKPLYQTREELDQAYVLGAVTDREYMRNRSAIWQVYSDRGHIANIAWLEEEVEKYQYALDTLEQWLHLRRIDSVAKRRKRLAQKRRKRTYNKYRNRRIRKPIQDAKREQKMAEYREAQRIEMEEAERRNAEERRQMEIESEEYFIQLEEEERLAEEERLRKLREES